MKSALRLIASFACAFALTACGGGGSDSPATIDPNTQPAATTFTDTQVGTGAVATVGATVTVNYTGWLYSAKLPQFKGIQFEKSSYSFVLGQQRVIPGWEKGIVGMSVGGKRTLVLTPEDGYGSRGNPPTIPANAGLLFEVELTAVAK